jgi:F0F1-type ATP synthase membrane subunit b/b'
VKIDIKLSEQYNLSMNKEKQTKNKITNEDLARIIQNSLTELKTELKSDIKELGTDVTELKVTINNIEANLNKKIDKIDHNTFKYRIEKLEEKFA